MRLKDKIAMITGAGQGIGKGIAQMFSDEGAKVVLLDINEEKVKNVLAEIEKKGGSGLAIKADVSDRKDVAAAAAKTVETFGSIDILVNNAGAAAFQPFMDIEDKDWDLILTVNAKGTFICTQEVAKQMIKQKSGKIINASSIAGKKGVAMQAHYCASKFAIVGLTQVTAIELAPYGITVNAFCPGVVDTPLWQRLDESIYKLGKSSKLGEAMREFADGALLKRYSTPEDVGKLVVFLASGEADYITGQSINVDGGFVFH